MTNLIEGMIGLLTVVAMLALLARRLQIPYPILLVIGGLGLAFIPGLPRPRLQPEMVFFLFLPPLLFQPALFTSLRDFRRNLRSIAMLAVGLVLFTMVLTGIAAHWLVAGMPLAAGLLLGAIISPPDAIAATSIAHRLRLPRRLLTVIEGESLLNDATALIAYKFALAAVVSGTFSLPNAIGSFFVAGLGGIAIGLLIGIVIAWVEARLEDPPVETTLTLLIPFVSYITAEKLGVSGVLSVVTTGFYLGWRSPEIVDARLRLQAGPVWEIVEFVLNGVVFILIGLQLPPILRNLDAFSTSSLFVYATLVNLAVILIRIVWVFPAAYLGRLVSHAPSGPEGNTGWREVTILAWTGMRGVVSLAAALALPLSLQGGQPFVWRDLILFLTFSVIFGTLVLQGLTLPFLIKSLSIKEDDSSIREEREARIKANEAALARLKQLDARIHPDHDAVVLLQTEYEDRLRQVKRAGQDSGKSNLFSEDYQRLAYETLQVERDILLELRNSGVIGDDVLRRIQRDIDFAEARLRFPDFGTIDENASSNPGDQPPPQKQTGNPL